MRIPLPGHCFSMQTSMVSRAIEASWFSTACHSTQLGLYLKTGGTLRKTSPRFVRYLDLCQFGGDLLTARLARPH